MIGLFFNTAGTSDFSAGFSYKDTLTSDLTSQVLSLHAQLRGLRWELFLTCFVIAAIWRLVEVIRSGSEGKTYPLGDILLHLVVVIILSSSFVFIYKGIIAFFNYTADAIMNVDNLEAFFEKLWGKQFNESMEMGIFSFKFRSFAGTLVGLIAQISILSLNIWRNILLTLFFILSPIIIGVSQIPLYGWPFLGAFFANIVQIASWSLLFSAINWIMSTVNFNNSIGNIEYIVYMFAYIVAINSVPSLAQLFFGGSNNFHPLVAATTMLSYGRISNIKNALFTPVSERAKQLSNFSNSPAGMVAGGVKNAFNGAGSGLKNFFKK